MKVKLKLGPLGQYQFTHDDKPLDNLYVLSVEPSEGNTSRVMVETIFIGEISKQPEFESPLEAIAKPKRRRPD